MPFPFDKNHYFITPFTDEAPPLLKGLHSRVFKESWGEETFANFLADKQVFGFMLHLVGQPQRVAGFILCRLISDEAEIITLAVDPNFRQRGIGHALMDAALRHLHHERAHTLFLEVDEKNTAAHKLYQNFGFEEVGRRPGYYQTEKGRSDALIMRRIFKQPSVENKVWDKT